MVTMIIIFLLFGLVEHVSTIKCYTCHEPGNYCSLPLNLDNGDESNENNIEATDYNAGYACMSEQTLNPRTDVRKLILRGVEQCEEINVPNHRVHCCYTDNCNKHPPDMILRTLADITGGRRQIVSNSQKYISSMTLIYSSLIFSMFLSN